jgi:hypothetical protein
VYTTGALLFDFRTSRFRCRIEPARLGAYSRFLDAAFSNDSTRVVTTEADRQTVWDIQTCHPLTTHLAASPSDAAHVAFSPDDNKIVASVIAKDRLAVEIWDANSGALVRRYSPLGVTSSSSNFNSRLLLSADGTRMLFHWMSEANGTTAITSLWDVETGAELHRFVESTNTSPVSSGSVVGFSSDGTTILVVDDDRPRSLWSAKTGELIRIYSWE